jgi:hypothetical protein
MYAVLDEDKRISSGVPAVLLLIAMILNIFKWKGAKMKIIYIIISCLWICSTAAFAQNQSQMGNAGCCNCTTQQCIENIRLTRLGVKNLCTTDKTCEEKPSVCLQGRAWDGPVSDALKRICGDVGQNWSCGVMIAVVMGWLPQLYWSWSVCRFGCMFHYQPAFTKGGFGFEQ